MSTQRTSLRLFRTPLVQFTLIGGLLFGLHRVCSSAATDDEQVRIDATKRSELMALFEQRQHRKPSVEETQGLLTRWAEEEALFREALRLDLVRQDPALRDQLIARMRSLLQTSAAPGAPSDEDLEQYLRAHRERYREPPKATFTEYLVQRGPGADSEARRLLRALQQGESVALVPVLHSQRTASELAALYGEGLSGKVMTLPHQQWSMLRSPRGLHLVKVENVLPTRDPNVEELRYRLTTDLRVERTQQGFQQRLAEVTARFPMTSDERSQ